jgi:ABC-2 type transport system ATP-binding protein
MRRRLDLAAGLTVVPEVMFLDEPTTGLDPRSRREIWAVVAELAAQGTTVLLTTQYLEEADRLAGRIAVLDRGRLVAEGTPAQLKERVAEQLLELVCLDGAAFGDVVRRLGGRAVRTDPQRLTVALAADGTADDVRRSLDDADPGRTALRSFAVRTASLDDVFLALTGQPASSSSSSDEFDESDESVSSTGSRANLEASVG